MTQHPTRRLRVNEHRDLVAVRGAKDKAQEETPVKTEEDTTMTEATDNNSTEHPQPKPKQPKPQRPKAKQPKPVPSLVGAGAAHLSNPIPKESAESRYPDHDVPPEVAALLRASAPDYTSEEEREIIRAFLAKVKTDKQAMALSAMLARGEIPGRGR